MDAVILTLFPEMVETVLDTSILKRARERSLLSVKVVDLRDYTEDRHHTADDTPYGGGAGMVLKPDPIFKAIDSIRVGVSSVARGSAADSLRLLLMSPQGRRFDQAFAASLSREDRKIVLICGRYEDIDERVRIGLKPEEVSVGDYVLSGGELAALILIDAATRLIPGALGDESSMVEESFHGTLDYPHYTRPAVFRGMEVPEVLRSGNHEQIRRWRRKEALRNTFNKRPDLLERLDLNEEDLLFLAEVKRECGVMGHS